MPPFLFLSSGLFLGWSLGAQDASNVFGTAVATRMVKFTTAAVICSIFVTIGAVVGGAGTAHTLGALGAVNAIGGAFVTSLGAALCVLWMTKLSLPVSVSQAVVGSIIGWNFFSGSVTDMASLVKIFSTWIICPILSGFVAVPVYLIVRAFLRVAKFHLLQLDAYTRFAMIVAGAFGSYSLGANNMANVVGVFVPVSPFTDFTLFGFTISSVHQLFFAGGLATAVGVCTYSKKVMMMIGKGLTPLSPVTAWVVVVSQAIVLFLFSSEQLEYFLASHGLPTLPLVPVSSTQAVIGAVIGLGLLKERRNIRWSALGRVMSGWVMTPVIAASVCFITLFFVQNIFNQPVYREVHYMINDAVVQKAEARGVSMSKLIPIKGKRFKSAVALKDEIRARDSSLDSDAEARIFRLSRLRTIVISDDKLATLDPKHFTQKQIDDIRSLAGKKFQYRFELEDALAEKDEAWKPLPASKLNRLLNRKLTEKLDLIEYTFSTNKT